MSIPGAIDIAKVFLKKVLPSNNGTVKFVFGVSVLFYQCLLQTLRQATTLACSHIGGLKQVLSLSMSSLKLT